MSLEFLIKCHRVNSVPEKPWKTALTCFPSHRSHKTVVLDPTTDDSMTATLSEIHMCVCVDWKNICKSLSLFAIFSLMFGGRGRHSYQRGLITRGRAAEKPFRLFSPSFMAGFQKNSSLIIIYSERSTLILQTSSPTHNMFLKCSAGLCLWNITLEISSIKNTHRSLKFTHSQFILRRRIHWVAMW